VTFPWHRRSSAIYQVFSCDWQCRTLGIGQELQYEYLWRDRPSRHKKVIVNFILQTQWNLVVDKLTNMRSWETKWYDGAVLDEPFWSLAEVIAVWYIREVTGGLIWIECGFIKYWSDLRGFKWWGKDPFVKERLAISVKKVDK